jgi:hypothetical protein
MFLLDTDYAVLLQRGSGPELRTLLMRMSAYADTVFYYPVIAFHEQMLGANAYIQFSVRIGFVGELEFRPDRLQPRGPS